MNTAQELSRLVMAQYEIRKTIDEMCSRTGAHPHNPLVTARDLADDLMDALVDAEQQANRGEIQVIAV